MTNDEVIAFSGSIASLILAAVAIAFAFVFYFASNKNVVKATESAKDSHEKWMLQITIAGSMTMNADGTVEIQYRLSGEGKVGEDKGRLYAFPKRFACRQIGNSWRIVEFRKYKQN